MFSYNEVTWLAVIIYLLMASIEVYIIYRFVKCANKLEDFFEFYRTKPGE